VRKGIVSPVGRLKERYYMIDWDMAYRLRFKSGFSLPIKEEKYSEPRIFEIAKEIHELELKISELHKEIMRNASIVSDEFEYEDYK
jgi:hypothetical protein